MPQKLLPTLALLYAVAPGPSHAAEPASTPAPRFNVQSFKDLAYYEGKDADPSKHRLDLYVPRDHKGFPVQVFVHGGAWQRGDKNGSLGVYGGIGSYFARHGIATAVINYRLSPAVKHPEHVRDVARAVAWTRGHIKEYGGDPDRLFLAGHSAGGHLVSLLATDESYLKEHRLSPDNVRGVISVSGVYTLDDALLPAVFGDDPAVRRKAWPLAHVKPDRPPFLVLYADKDYAPCAKEPSETFCRALRAKGNKVRSVEARDSNHFNILLSLAVPDAPVAQAVLSFLQERAGK